MLSQQVFPADLQVAFKWPDALAEGTLCQSCAGWCVSDPNEFLLFHGFIPGGAPHFENTSSLFCRYTESESGDSGTKDRRNDTERDFMR